MCPAAASLPEWIGQESSDSLFTRLVPHIKRGPPQRIGRAIGASEWYLQQPAGLWKKAPSWVLDFNGTTSPTI